MTGTLVILRHGESTWNQQNLFTGWHDVPLSEKGLLEAPAAGRTMADEGLRFDVAHTSLLTRAVVTCHLALEAMGQVWLPVQRHWRLNERHYGALQGLDKKATTERHGAEQTNLWRRSYDVPPPPVGTDHPEHPASDSRYRLLPPDVLPASECLADVVARVLPYWHDVVAPQLLAGCSG
jgi:2,3-bisphosphoglycerate-dependent phosphoglycerate mutase